MPTYVIEAPHTEEECMAAFEEFMANPRAQELLSKTVAACEFGDHTMWTIADFDTPEDARKIVNQDSIQQKMRIQQVATMTPEEIKETHGG